MLKYNEKKVTHMFNNYTPYNEQETNDLKLIQETYLKMDNIYTRDNQTAHFTSSSWIINKEKTKVLMIYHTIYDSWAWTGGRADCDTALPPGANKEAKEREEQAKIDAKIKPVSFIVENKKDEYLN